MRTAIKYNYNISYIILFDFCLLREIQFKKLLNKILKFSLFDTLNFYKYKLVIVLI